MIKVILTGLLVSLLWQHSLWADDDERQYNQIALSVTATDEIKSDILVALLYVQEEGRTPDKLAKIVNQKIAQAVDRARRVAGVKVETLNYRTSPYYKKQKIAGWRVRQSIRLESRDFGLLSKLIGELQEVLALEYVSYQVSHEKRAEAENLVIAKAIAAFKTRAALIADTLEFPSYRVLNMNINTSGVYPVSRMSVRSEMYTADGLQQMPSPVLEGGTQTIQISINGKIELQHGKTE